MCTDVAKGTTRAPLGQKTTNAKAKFQTPGPAVNENDLAKAKQRSASARKKGPRISHAEPVHIDILSDKDLDDDLDIGVIHPRPKELLDIPTDLPDLDLSLLQGNFVEPAMRYVWHKPDADGISLAQRKQMKLAEEMRIIEAQTDAMTKRSLELCAAPPCTHEPDCAGEECKDEPERRRRIEEEYQRTIAALWPSQQSTSKSIKESKPPGLKKRPTVPMPKSTIVPNKAAGQPIRSNAGSSGPSAALSRAAAVQLSTRPASVRPPTKNPAVARAPARVPKLNGTSRPLKNTTTGSSHHAVATHVSNTTMGYAKGRAVSGTKRASILPRSDLQVFQAPRADIEAQREEGSWQSEELRRILIEDALDDFQLELPED